MVRESDYLAKPTVKPVLLHWHFIVWAQAMLQCCIMGNVISSVFGQSKAISAYWLLLNYLFKPVCKFTSLCKSNFLENRLDLHKCH